MAQDIMTGPRLSDPEFFVRIETTRPGLGGIPRAVTEQFDVILNDMRMDAQDSAQITVAAARNLKESGWALLTLKLPKKGMERMAALALEVLRKRCEVTGARQLFHSRNEITVALRLVN